MTEIVNEVKDLLKQTFQEWGEDKASRLAAALAYYTVFSIPPLILLSLSIIGQIYDQQTAQMKIMDQVAALTGPSSTEMLGLIFENISEEEEQGIFAGISSIVILIFGASGVFGALQDSLNTVWDVQADPKRGIMGTIRDRFFSFTMVLSVAFLLLVSLIVSAGLSALNDNFLGLLPGAIIVANILNFVVSFAIIIGLFALIFKYVPDVEIEWGDVWVGAVVTALLFTIGKWGIGLYLGQSAPGSAFGAAGSLVIFLLWTYYSSQILFLGAEFTQVYAKKYGSRLMPAEGAIPLTPEMRANQGIPKDVAVPAPHYVQPPLSAVRSQFPTELENDSFGKKIVVGLLAIVVALQWRKK